MAFSTLFLDRVKDNNPIASVVSDYLGEDSLKPHGPDLVAVCPFHDEKTPSFHVSPSRNICTCFGGCGRSWDVFAFVCAHEKCTFPQAVEILAKRAGLSLEDGRENNAPKLTPRKTEPKPQKIDVIPAEWVTRCRYNETTNFYKFLAGVFDPVAVGKVCDLYHLGGTRDGRCIFWEIDERGRVRGGKVMQYNPTTGHRVKPENPKDDRTTWAHKIPVISATLAPGWKMSQCLFGEHLLQEKPLAPVGIVESEKTAIICAIRYPQIVWVSVGGFLNFQPARLGVLKGRNVTAYPDIHPAREFAEKWQEIADDIDRRQGIKIAINETFQDIATPAQVSAKLDIGDILINSALADRPTTPQGIAERFAQMNPAFTTLCERLHLQIVQ